MTGEQNIPLRLIRIRDWEGERREKNAKARRVGVRSQITAMAPCCALNEAPKGEDESYTVGLIEKTAG